MIWSSVIALVSFIAALALISRNRHLADGVKVVPTTDSPAGSLEEKVSALGAQAAQAASVGFLVLLKNFFGLLARLLILVEKKIHRLLNRIYGRNQTNGERDSASFFLRHIAEHKKTLDKNGL